MSAACRVTEPGSSRPRPRPFSAVPGRPGGLAGLAVLAVLLTACPAAEDTGGTRAYVERLGTDTMSVEVYRRTPDGFEGDLVLRSPVTRRVHYRATLGPDGAVRTLEANWTTPPENPEGPEPIQLRITVEGEGATVEREGGRSPGTDTVAAPPGAIPMTGATPPSYAVLEQAVRQALAAGGDSVPVHFITASGRLSENAIERLDENTVSIDFFGSPVHLEIASDGRILSRSGARTTMKVEGELVEGPVEIEALAADFAGRDARGEGMGVASPQATVQATMDGANLEVVYSRPAARGREIWGALVPYGEVWRTGANAATAFSTDMDLQIGEASVPAGEYTLYSLYTADSAELIVNRQTGQWGTVYDPGQDLARVEMTRETLDQPVERFTISLEDAEDGGRLRLAWDRTAFSVPIRVR